MYNCTAYMSRCKEYYTVQKYYEAMVDCYWAILNRINYAAAYTGLVDRNNSAFCLLNEIIHRLF